MSRRSDFVLLSLVALLASACATAKPRPDYVKYAGDPVASIRYTQLYNWQRNDRGQVVIWTKPNTAYLLTLRHSCDALDGQVAIQIGGVASIPGKIFAGSDDVLVGQLRCPIATIQPIDLERMKKER